MWSKEPRKIYYVRGYVNETIKTTIMLTAWTEVDAKWIAEDFGVKGEIQVFTKDEWDTIGGLDEGENFIVGYCNHELG